MSLSAEVLAILRCGPRFKPGGDRGGLRISGMLGFMLWKVICVADGDVQGSVDSMPVQVKLFQIVSFVLYQLWVAHELTIGLPVAVGHAELRILPTS